MALISNLNIFFYLSNIYFQFFLYKYNRFLRFHMIPAALLLISSFFFFLNLIIFIAFCKFVIQSLPLFTSCLFTTFLNYDLVDIEKFDGICSLTFVVDKRSRLLLLSSVISIIHSRSA